MIMKTQFFLGIFFSAVSFYGQEVIISENFEQGLPPNWEIHTDNPKRKWYPKSYNDVPYMQMSAFGGKGKKGYHVKTELVGPSLELENKTCKLRFSFADAYQNGQPLSVAVVDHSLNVLHQFDSKLWKNLVNNKGRYDNIYEATDWMLIPNFDHPIRIAFIYDSRKKITTLIQLSEVDVWCME